MSFGNSCKYLELHIPKTAQDSNATDLPIYLAYPDSLGLIKVSVFLEGSENEAKKLLKPSDWQVHPLSVNEKKFLQALRDFMSGHIHEAGTAIGTLSQRPPSALKAYLKIDRGLLLLLTGFSEDAEKAWLQTLNHSELDDNKSCAEGAWKNLYSLYLGKKDFTKAHGLVDTVLRASPKNKWANFAKGYLLRMLAPGDEWEHFLKEKSSWQDSLFEIQIAYGKFLKERGQLTEATKYYGRGLEGAPKNGPAWLELADIYYKQGYLVFAEMCIQEAFKFGINDPFIFELYSLVLQAVSERANGSDARWNAAERLLEEGFPHDLQSRSMAQLLYHVYSHNGKVDAAQNLRESFWFHFQGPRQIKHLSLEPEITELKHRLRIHFSEVSFPLVRALENTDFFEPF